jgi:hypothetical protein
VIRQHGFALLLDIHGQDHRYVLSHSSTEYIWRLRGSH